ncbi:hypothetical protein B1A99_17825 [Cohnella sp. CIP 111063]|jgi:hypothetical protein|uniref:hypothetical protein n=1 Tax=unclassified Cohnella TaxID=2636738 RepID=UPI000B8BE821|nr:MULTISPECIES: hypothetical protein [unclassified Cohnella]OXS57346.1 hypothetical protein B1A99_17825 [Cohnella sp. CIP 111063]PRX70788.1 hypothetical protein B0G52_111155 [Cohnella sp. SGD-V74]
MNKSSKWMAFLIVVSVLGIGLVGLQHKHKAAAATDNEGILLESRTFQNSNGCTFKMTLTYTDGILRPAFCGMPAFATPLDFEEYDYYYVLAHNSGAVIYSLDIPANLAELGSIADPTTMSIGGALHYSRLYGIPKRNIAPDILISTNGELISSSGVIRITGKAWDQNRDTLRVSAALGGVLRMDTIADAPRAAPGADNWVLEWEASEIAEGTYENLVVTVEELSNLNPR